MIKHIVEVKVNNAKAELFYDFMINPSTKRYRAWWPGEHLDFHIVKPGDADHLGDVVYMDEYLGGPSGPRLRFRGIVIAIDRPKEITWQMLKFGLRLPAFVTICMHDIPGGIVVKHELRIGYSGIGTILDPLIRLYFNKSFQNALETHCKIEWPKLAEYLEDKSHEN